MAGIRTRFCYCCSVFQIKRKDVPLGNIDVINLFEKDVFIKFGKTQHFRADFLQILVIECAADRASIAFLLFLIAATDPEFLIMSVKAF